MMTVKTRAMSEDWPEKPSVAFLGPEGTYSHSATLKFFTGCLPVPCMSIEEVFAAVAGGDAQFGVAPVENSAEGSIVQTLDCLSQGGIHICGEVMLRIHHAFLVSELAAKEAVISRIYSHQQSLGQCRQWLRDHYPEAVLTAVSSNSEAARLATTEPDSAAIAGEAAAGIYGLRMLHRHIEDTHDNTTRFAVISRQFTVAYSGNDKTSLMLSAHDEPGTLFRALEPFHRYGVSLTRLESRPSRRAAWSYTFYLDLLGHVEDEPVRNALGDLRKLSVEVTVLGSYPRADLDR